MDQTNILLSPQEARNVTIDMMVYTNPKGDVPKAWALLYGVDAVGRHGVTGMVPAPYGKAGTYSTSAILDMMQNTLLHADDLLQNRA